MWRFNHRIQTPAERERSSSAAATISRPPAAQRTDRGPTRPKDPECPSLSPSFATANGCRELQRAFHGGFFYNGLPFEGLVDGVDTLGIHNAKDGIVTRGVLVDMAWFTGVDFLEPGTAIMPKDFEAWEERTGIEVGSGDVLLVRTGRWERVRQKGQWNFLEQAAGAHAALAKWLRARDVAAIGCDGVSDVMPGNVEGLVNPLHQLVLAGLGMLILDNLDLDAVATEARKRGRWQFLFVGAPLRVRGGTGSPLNPLAVF